jgi:hypothetical protein
MVMRNGDEDRRNRNRGTSPVIITISHHQYSSPVSDHRGNEPPRTPRTPRKIRNRIQDQGSRVQHIYFRVLPCVSVADWVLLAARFAFDLIRVHLRSSAAQFGLGFRRRSSAAQKNSEQ